MPQKKNENNVAIKKKRISLRKFWRLITLTIGRNFSFHYEYKNWLWKKSERKQYIIEMYRIGYNQIEIAGILMMSPLKIRRILKELRKSLEWNIKTKRLLEDS